MKIKDFAKQEKQYVIDLRRHFHMYPETGWNEEKTSQKIKDELSNLGIPFVPVAKTGVIATIKGRASGKTIALRADIDALEVNESNDLAYKSKNKGISHACGHDAHTAMLLGAAKILNQIEDEIKGTVKLIFQPAEELLNGAETVIEEGGLDGVDSIFGIHIIGLLPSGMVAVGTGPILSSADFFKIHVKGKGGHGGMPHQGVDTAVTASAIVMNLQTIASREISPMEPVVVSIGKLNAGTRNNVIAGEAFMEGTTRCYNDDVRKKLPEAMERIIQNTASAYRAEAYMDYVNGVPSTVNEAACAERARIVIGNLLGKEALLDSPPMTGAEDFAFYQQKVPGVFVFLGAGNEDKGAIYPQHHEKFTIDEDALEAGTMLNVQYTLEFLNEK